MFPLLLCYLSLTLYEIASVNVLNLLDHTDAEYVLLTNFEDENMMTLFRPHIFTRSYPHRFIAKNDQNW